MRTANGRGRGAADQQNSKASSDLRRTFSFTRRTVSRRLICMEGGLSVVTGCREGLGLKP